MYPYPFFNLIFYSFLLLLLVVRLITFNYASQKELSGYILRHPVEENGFQIIDFNDWRLKTQLYPKYYVGEYIELENNQNNDSKFLHFPIISKNDSMTYSVIASLSGFRSFLIERVKSSLPQPYSGLLLGFTLGYEQDSEHLKEVLIATGVIHLVVFSGSNVSFLYSFASPLLYRLNRWLYFIFLSFLLAFILLLVGVEAPVLRAVFMVFFSGIAKISGFYLSGFINLFLTLLIMLFIFPPFMFDLSFQLSFIASVVVVVVSEFLSFLKESLYKEFLHAGFVTLFLYPMISFYFGVFSLKSLFANLLIVPIVPLVLVFGFIYILLPLLLFKIINMSLIYCFILVSEFLNSVALISVDFEFTFNMFLSFYALMFFLYLIWVFKLKRLFIGYE